MVRDNITDVIKALEEIGENLVNWLSNNENEATCYLLLNSQEPNTLKLGDLHINDSISEKLLDIIFNMGNKTLSLTLSLNFNFKILNLKFYCPY